MISRNASFKTEHSIFQIEKERIHSTTILEHGLAEMYVIGSRCSPGGLALAPITPPPHIMLSARG